MTDDPRSDEHGAADGSHGPGDETVEGIGGDPFPSEPAGGSQPVAADGGSRVEGIPEGWRPGPGVPADGETFEPVADGPRSASGPSGANEGEDSASQMSRVQIGTGQSGIVSPSDVISDVSSAGPPQQRSRWILAEDPSEAEPDAEGRPAGSAGDDRPEDRSGDPEEWRDPPPAGRDEAASESIEFGAFLASTEAGEPAGGGDSLDGQSQGIGETALDGLDLGAGAGGGRRVDTRADAGALRRQLVGVLLGGLLAIPVTQAILLWGFGRDPFQVTRRVPSAVRFLLPAKFRGPVPRRPEGRDTESFPTLDGLAARPASVPATARDAGATALGEAVAAAVAATDRRAARAPADGGAEGDRADWYRLLATAAARLAEADRDPGSEPPAPAFAALAERLAADHAADVETLGGAWLEESSRPSDGAVLVGRLEGVRAVGPWWGGNLSVQAATPRRVLFLCRDAPGPREGDRVLVAGVLVDPTTLWVSAVVPVSVADAAAGDAEAAAPGGG